MTRRDVYIVAATRTAVGSFGGALKDISPTSLAETDESVRGDRTPFAQPQFEQPVSDAAFKRRLEPHRRLGRQRHRVRQLCKS